MENGGRVKAWLKGIRERAGEAGEEKIVIGEGHGSEERLKSRGKEVKWERGKAGETRIVE